MRHFIKSLCTFSRNESGAAAIEYGLIAAGVSIAISGAITLLGGKLTTVFTSVNAAL